VTDELVTGQTLATFRIDAATERVTLEMPGYGDLDLGWREGLRAAREGTKLDWMLTMFRGRVSKLRPSLSALAGACRDLDRDAGVLAHRLVDDDPDLLDELRLRFVHAWPQWRNPGDVVPVVEIIGHDDLYPFELLPVFDASRIDRFENYAEAERGFQRFLGFGTMVRRVTGEQIETEPLEGRPPLAMQLMRFDLEGAVAEEAYFGRTRTRFALEGPSHPDVLGADAVERVIDVLYDPGLRLDGLPRTGATAQIHHLACHCDTTSTEDDNYVFTLGDDGEHRCPVTLGALRDGFRKRIPEHGRYGRPRPLVVMNACGSSAISVRTSASFPKWFLKTRHRAFVGTETDIPDLVGAAFAARLYDALLGHLPLGVAVVLARRRLMAEEHNPLGLVYSLYGDPFLTVGCPRAR
jgi:hypothetical protein